MIKIVLAAVASSMLLSGHPALAQTEGQCDQVRAAVAQYGYKAAKAHADATMSPGEVRAASRCLTQNASATNHHGAARRHHRRHHILR